MYTERTVLLKADLYPAKILDLSAKSFFLCRSKTAAKFFFFFWNKYIVLIPRVSSAALDIFHLWLGNCICRKFIIYNTLHASMTEGMNRRTWNPRQKLGRDQPYTNIFWSLWHRPNEMKRLRFIKFEKKFSRKRIPRRIDLWKSFNFLLLMLVLTDKYVKIIYMC